MDNHINNSASPNIDNAMNPVINGAGQFDSSRLTWAAVLAFLPNFGIFGIHNFILKQYKKGILHIIIVITAFIPTFLINTFCHSGNCSNVFAIAMLLECAAFGSYIWALIEGIQILQLKKQKSVIPLQTVNELKNIQEKKQDRKIWSILSIIFTIIPIIVWAQCFVASGGSASDAEGGAAWWLLGMFYWSLGIPLAIMSISFGIVGLKTSLRWLSIVSFLLKAAMIVTIILLFITLF